MNIIRSCLLDVRVGTFDFFDEVYLFGSSLETNDPEDIDLILVYRNGLKLSEVSAARQNVVDTLCLNLEGKLIDTMTLSEVELVQSGILERIRHKRIKGSSTQRG